MDGYDSVYQEAMFMAEIYGIPKIIIDDYYEAYVQFVREELKKRVKTGVPTQVLNPEVLFTVIMGEANVE